jgi:hypothetical protein
MCVQLSGRRARIIKLIGRGQVSLTEVAYVGGLFHFIAVTCTHSSKKELVPQGHPLGAKAAFPRSRHGQFLAKMFGIPVMTNELPGVIQGTTCIGERCLSPHLRNRKIQTQTKQYPDLRRIKFKQISPH